MLKIMQRKAGTLLGAFGEQRVVDDRVLADHALQRVVVAQHNIRLRSAVAQKHRQTVEVEKTSSIFCQRLKSAAICS